MVQIQGLGGLQGLRFIGFRVLGFSPPKAPEEAPKDWAARAVMAIGGAPTEPCFAAPWVYRPYRLPGFHAGFVGLLYVFVSTSALRV